MSFDKNYPNRKDWRKQDRRGVNYDCSCNWGACEWCGGHKKHREVKMQLATEAAFKDYELRNEPYWDEYWDDLEAESQAMAYRSLTRFWQEEDEREVQDQETTAAFDKLADDILDAVEQKQMPQFSQEIADTLKELTSNPDFGQEIKPEEVRGWLRNLSDQALSETC